MKTALQQLQDKMQKIRDESTDPKLIGVAIAMQYYIKELLPTEQAIIEASYEDGFQSCNNMMHTFSQVNDDLCNKSEYFTSKFNGK